MRGSCDTSRGAHLARSPGPRSYTSACENWFSPRAARSGSSQSTRILILVMTYVDCVMLPCLVPAILETVLSSSIRDVDAISPDGTADVVRAFRANDARVDALTRRTERGYGSATIAGLQYGVRNGYDVIAT